MQLLIIGTGYVGLVTGTCFAENGYNVTCLDIDQKKIDLLNQKQLPFYEPGLADMVSTHIGSRLFFTTDYKSALDQCDLCFLALPTPSLNDGSCDLSYLYSAIDTIAENLNKDLIVVMKSTVPVGTCEAVEKHLNDKVSYQCSVISNPEFLRQGSALQDCLKPDRIIIGSDDPKLTPLLQELYHSFTINRNRLLIMSRRSAEMAKYAANAMLATRISFMNELSGLCEKLDVNINDVRQGIGSDSRIGYHFLYPGIGFGGSCFPKDLRALQAMGAKNDYSMPLLNAVEEINERQKRLLSKKISAHLDHSPENQMTIAIWGLSFKPHTDDLREAPSLALINELLSKNIALRLYDPIALPNAQRYLKNHPLITWCKDEYDAAEGADGIALVTEWKQFLNVNLERILQKMRGNAIFDGRNQFIHLAMNAKGFQYFPIGIPKT